MMRRLLPWLAPRRIPRARLKFFLMYAILAVFLAGCDKDCGGGDIFGPQSPPAFTGPPEGILNGHHVKAAWDGNGWVYIDVNSGQTFYPEPESQPTAQQVMEEMQQQQQFEDMIFHNNQHAPASRMTRTAADASSLPPVIYQSDTAANALIRIPYSPSAMPRTGTAIPLPKGAAPGRLTVDLSGDVWVVETGLNKLARVSQSGAVTQVSLPDAAQRGISKFALSGIAFGPCDSRIWVGESWQTAKGSQQEALAAVNPATFGVKTVSLPGAGAVNDVSLGPDCNMWYVDSAGVAGRVGVSTGAVKQYPLGLPKGAQATRLIVDPKGKVWFGWSGAAGSTSRGVGSITVATGAVWRHTLSLSEEATGAATEDLTLAANGTIWVEYGGDLFEVTESGAVTRFPDTAGKPVGAIAADSAGNVFATGPYGQIGRFTPSQARTYTVTQSQFTDPQVQVAGITPGPDGNLWFTEYAGDVKYGTYTEVGRYTPSGAVTFFKVPTVTTLGAITTGRDGNLWFTEPGVGKIGRLTTSGTLTEFSVPYPAEPAGIAAGPDGNLWFTDPAGGTIGRITQAGRVTDYPAPFTNPAPSAIVAGPDGNMWFTDPGDSAIGRFSPSDPGAMSEFQVFGLKAPTPDKTSFPMALTIGPDGNLWFVDYGRSSVGRMLVKSPHTVTEFPAPWGAGGEIAAGSDGRLWVSSLYRNMTAITTNGEGDGILVRGNSGTAGVTLGPDGNIWFSDANGGAIGSIGTAGKAQTYVLDLASGFVNPSRTVPLGHTVTWLIQAPDTHTIIGQGGGERFQIGR